MLIKGLGLGAKLADSLGGRGGEEGGGRVGERLQTR